MIRGSPFFRRVAAPVMCVLGAAVPALAGEGPTSRPRRAGNELVVPIRLAHLSSPNVLAAEESGREGLFTCAMSAGAIRRFVILSGIVRPAQGEGEVEEDDVGSPMLTIHVSAHGSGHRAVPLEDVIACAGGEVTGRVRWRFQGVSADPSERGGRSAGVIISSADEGSALIVPVLGDKPLAGGEVWRVARDVDWIRSSSAELSLILRPVNTHVVVLLLDRFGRVWYGGERIRPPAVANALRERRKTDSELEVEILCDPFALPLDQERLIDLCRESGVVGEKIRSRRADGRLGLDELTIAEHESRLQHLAISAELSRKVAPWEPIRRSHEDLIEQVRQGMRNYWSQFERFREQVSRWHEDYQGLTTRKADAMEP